MQIEPLRDIVVIQREEIKETHNGGMIVVANADKQEEPPRGVVLKVGPGRILETGELIPPSVSVGDVVIFAPQSGHPIKLGGIHDDLTIVMTELEIIGILTEDK